MNYSQINSRYEKQTEWTKNLRKKIIKEIPANAKILEVGCGTNAVMRRTHAEISHNSKFFGIDIDINALLFSKKISTINFNNSCADGLSLPFPDETFDWIFCHYLLLWTKYPVKILTEMKRVCKKNGFISALAEPDYESRIDFPDTRSKIGKIQTNFLIQNGINTQAGRHLPLWFSEAGIQNCTFGIFGNNSSFQENLAFIQMETLQEAQDGEMANNFYSCLPSDILFIPTFYCYGRKD